MLMAFMGLLLAASCTTKDAPGTKYEIKGTAAFEDGC